MCHREDVAAVKMVAKVKVVTTQRYRPAEDGATVKMWPSAIILAGDGM